MCSSDLVEGGRWMFEQLEALRDRHGCEVVALLGGAEGPTVDLCRNAGIRVEVADFRFHGWTGFFTMPWRMLKLAWWMRRERFDVVQSHVPSSTFLARPAAWLADVPVRLVMVTGPFAMMAPASRWMEIATVFMETGVIPSCELTGELYRAAGVDSKRVLPVLYYGPPEQRFTPEAIRPANIRAELGLAPEAPLIASAAIFYPRCPDNAFVPVEVRNRFAKGHTDIIEAMHIVLNEFAEARLLLIGKGWGATGGQAEQELRDFVHADGLDDAVLFLGWRSDLPEIYVDIDVSVQASLNENLGGTVESLLMARPTVATRVGGMVDAVIDGETGLLANPGDPASLADAILRLLRDREAAGRRAQEGRAHMLARFTLERTVPELDMLYRGQCAVNGAFRPWKSALRLAYASVLLFTVLGRAMLFDFYLHLVMPARLRQLRVRWRRVRHIGGRIMRGGRRTA